MLVLALLLAGCGAAEEPPPTSVEGVSSQAPGVMCVPPSPLAAAPDPPPPVVLPAGAVLTDVSVQAGQRLVTGRVELTVSEVLQHFRRDPSFVVTAEEDEGPAGRLRLFGRSGQVDVTVAELTCPSGLTGFTVAAPVTEASPGA